METYQQNQADNIGQQVELYIQCKNLKDLDILSKSDPKVVLYNKEGNSQQYQKIGSTEVLKNNLNPDFKTPIKIFYKFEVHQNLKFEVIDYDSDSKFEIIGTVETALGTVVGSRELTYEADIHIQDKKATRGKLIVKVVPVQQSNIEVILKIGARSMPAHSSCCSSTRTPCFEISKAVRTTGASQYYRCYKSETINNSEAPSFKVLKMEAQQLCNSDLDNPVQFKFQNVVDGQNMMIGIVERSISSMKTDKEFDIINPTNGQKAGVMILEQLLIREKPQFIQFLQMGWQISMCAAIDFTASNGNPSRPDSLHFLGAVNQYEQATRAIGSILEYYDSDKKFPVYGFGGVPKFMGINQVNHCFPLNGAYDNPEVQGTEGVLQLYRQNLPGIDLSGPTYFAPILQQMIAIVKQRSTQQTYNILLILTDGEIHDMEKTKEIIVEASGLPLSIIIIGVGNEKFKMMKALDSDKSILRDTHGKTAARDIVQFVKFKKYAANSHELAQKVLKEVPDQLVNYMMLKGILPPGFQAA